MEMFHDGILSSAFVGMFIFSTDERHELFIPLSRYIVLERRKSTVCEIFV